ncbi:hypothetical protein [Planotetraspora kaengkrachanensis]|uniref:DUF3558 domain-containing protein n=1 Tax=Planotetraspora kaengkrachanensis TaxID=575193 RepID=A0A8J3LX21_9ACTN|nr:hypothetical protein [Planotetraspora kaengkrachanensis]GIG78058.1 hypothetical protein Pka01_11850 [Planotetraspora kaengkrachanensis]
MNSRSVRARLFRWATALSLTTGALATAACGASAASPAPTATVTVTVTEEPAAAPSTPDAAAAPAGAVNACELVTHEEAEKLAGTPLNDGIAGDPSTPSCTYTGPTTGPTAQVEVYAGDGAKKILDIDRSLKHKFTEVPGVGDEAHYEDNMIFFLKSGTWVGIRLVLLTDPAANKKPMEELAAKAAARL